MKRYKISESNLNEFWGWFGEKKPQTMQQVIDNDPVLKQLDKELENIATSYIPRFKQMKKEEITALEVVWYETFTGKTKSIPTFVEATVLQSFLKDNGSLPKWNVAF